MPVIHYEPTSYQNAFGGHAPVLRVRAGDTVVTSTADAHGIDGNNREIAQRGNPLTGPFYIEGAQRGDSLAVRLDVLKPNRLNCWSHASIAPNTVDPVYVPALPEQGYVDWVIEPEGGFDRTERSGRNQMIARLVDGKISRRGLAFPVTPMLGCIGVAPPSGQVISSLTSGQHGGNMDWRGVAEGVTVSFPVFEEGGLLYIGDGHACQGDGEIVGSGVEVSFDVQFTVTVIREKQLSWPRGEDSASIFTIGNARPLEQALQNATTEMLKWLREEYALDAVEAGLTLGFSASYEVGNVFDPAFTMVCRVPKKYLSKQRNSM